MPTACGDGAVFIAVAGSGEHFKTPVNSWVSRELKAVYDGMRSTAGPGTVGLRMVDYSPASVDVLTASLNKIRARSEADFVGQAQNKGTSNLSRYIAAKDYGVSALWEQYHGVLRDCPADTKIVLGGYSQGAAVVHEFLNQLGAGDGGEDYESADDPGRQIAAAVLIADPERLAGSAVSDSSTATADSFGVCQLLAFTLSCSDPEPVADVQPPFAALTYSICLTGDVACDTSDVYRELVAAWDSRSDRSALLTRARKVHGAYAALPVTTALGRVIGAGL